MGIKFFKKVPRLDIDPRNLDIKTVEELLQGNMTINTVFCRMSSKGKLEKTTFLHDAIVYDHEELINWLIERKVDPNVKIPNVRSTIGLAIIDGNVETVQKLVSLGARVNARENKAGATPLCFASNNRRNSIVKYLIENGADVNKVVVKKGPILKRFSILQIYALQGDLEMTKFVLSKGAKINHKSADGFTPFLCAFQGRNLEVIKLLIERGAVIEFFNLKNYGSLSLVNAASLIGSIHVMEFICSLDEIATDVNSAVKKNKKWMLQNKERFNCIGNVSFLLDAGFDVNAKDKKGHLPIQYNNSYKYYEIYSLLKNHLLKLISADLPVCEQNKLAVQHENFTECRQEVTRMKAMKVGGANITFYDVLHVGEDYLARKIKRFQSELNEISNREKLSEMYPLYGGMLAVKMAKAKRRILRCEKAGETLMEIFIVLELSYDFMRALLDYLDLRDLKKISGEKI